jgi:hypothetical protein
MVGRFTESLSDAELDLGTRRRLIVDIWCAIDAGDSSGATTWDVIEDIRIRVTDFLASGTENDIRNAERLTAEALCRWHGLNNQ